MERGPGLIPRAAPPTKSPIGHPVLIIEVMPEECDWLVQHVSRGRCGEPSRRGLVCPTRESQSSIMFLIYGVHSVKLKKLSCALHSERHDQAEKGQAKSGRQTWGPTLSGRPRSLRAKVLTGTGYITLAQWTPLYLAYYGGSYG